MQTENLAIPNRIHVLGASGTGTTTLGFAVSREYGHRHLDTDDFFWLPTDPPYDQKRPSDQRLKLLRAATETASWVLTGSLCGWGDPLIPEFELVIFIVLDKATRMERLRAREIERYGEEAIDPGGAMHKAHVAFLEWAEQYDETDLNMRSLAVHETWIKKLTCPVMRLKGDLATSDQLMELKGFVRSDV